MVKNKNFKSGLDMLIQNTAHQIEQPEPKEAPKEKQKQKAETDAKEPERQLTITIPSSLKRRIKKYCAINDITIKDLFIESVTTHMNENE